MDAPSVKLVVEQLARLHSASHHYLDHFPDGGVDGFKRAHPAFINDRWLFSRSAEMDERNDEKYAMCMDVLLQTWREFGDDERLAAKLARFAPGVVRFMKERLATREETFNCLIHNDVWVNNCMFRWEGNLRHAERESRMLN